MKNDMGRMLALAVTFAGIMLLGSLGTGIVAATTTYSVTFTEVGLPTGTAWTATLAGVSMTKTTPTITFTGIAAANSVYWNISTVANGSTAQYYPHGDYYGYNYGYMNIPSETANVIVFHSQFQVGFGFTPAGAGGVSPASTGWYDAGSQIPVNAGHYTGYAFSGWKTSPLNSVVFGNASSASTMATINHPATITAKFIPTKAKVTFTEVGLPTGANWQVIFNGVAHASTTSSISVGNFGIGSYSWTVPPFSVTSIIQFAPVFGSGSMSVPYQTLQAVSFVKQVQLAFTVNPSGGGSTTPSTTAFYTNGSTIALSAESTSTTVFNKWSAGNAFVSFASTTSSATAATITGASTITAKFVTGTPCTTCTVTFNEVGLPSGSFWGVTAAGSFYGSNSATITLTGQTAGFYWSVSNPISSKTAGVAYSTTTVSGYMYVPTELKQTIVYTPVYWVNLVMQPYYSATIGPYSGYYAAGEVLPIWSSGTDVFAFKSWSSNSTSLTLASTKAASTTLTVGGPGTITALFAPPLVKVQFVEYNLAKGTVWGIAYDGSTFYSNTGSINVTAVPAGYLSWTVTSPIAHGAGVQYAAINQYGSFDNVYQTVEAIVFQETFLVTFTTSGTAGGSISPSGAAYYVNGSVWSIGAADGTTATFSSWSASPAASIAFGVATGKTHAASSVTINGPATVTAAFV